MLKEAPVSSPNNNFNLKNTVVNLVPTTRKLSRTSMTVGELENARTKRSALPASKHSLELICGGSCETGAQ
jgi:hypothetical protein